VNINIDFRKIWPDLLCLVPVYARDGTNGTEIRLENRGSLFSPFKTKTLVRQLARVFTLDLKAAHERYGELSGRRYAVPLPLRPGLVLIPVYARRARVKDDGTRAYVVQGKIAGIDRRANSGRTRFVFVDGTYLDVPHRYDSLRNLLIEARLIEKEAASLFTGRPRPRWNPVAERIAERGDREWPVGCGSGRSGWRPEQP